MTDYIEREATIELLRSLGSREYRREKGTIQEAIKMLSFSEYTPAADVAPVRHGRWDRVIPSKSAAKWSSKVSCSVCHNVGYNHFKYCPNCGAKMDGGADNETS